MPESKRLPPSGVFFPACGNVNDTSLNNGGTNGNYWSSSLNTSNTNNAYNLNFNSSSVNPSNNNNRYNGRTVRPVSAFAHVTLHTV